MSFWGQSHQNMWHVKAHGFVLIVPFYTGQHNTTAGLTVKPSCCTLQHQALGWAATFQPLYISQIWLVWNILHLLYCITSAIPLLEPLIQPAPSSDIHTHFPLTSYNVIRQLQPFSLFWIAPWNSLQWVMPTVLSWWKLISFSGRKYWP